MSQNHANDGQVIAAAEVRFLQMQVQTRSGKTGLIYAQVCGPNDRFVSKSFLRLLNESERKIMPQWMSDALDNLPPSRFLDFQGRPVGSVKIMAPEGVSTDDLGFASA